MFLASDSNQNFYVSFSGNIKETTKKLPTTDFFFEWDQTVINFVMDVLLLVKSSHISAIVLPL